METSRIIGPPGCGKTTYLSRQVRLAWEAGHEVMVCSLTRAAAQEVAGRDLPIGRQQVGTLHSHAYRALVGGFAGIADLPKYIDEWNAEHPRLALSGGNGDLDEDNANPYSGETPNDKAFQAMNLRRAMLKPGLLINGVQPTTMAQYEKLWPEWKKANDLIDFTDMLELALSGQEQAPGAPGIIFADESQDFSALEWALLQKWGESAGRLIITGDPYQNLYEWRGSDSDLFIGDGDYRVLQQSYRVPVAVHHAAVSFLEGMPGYQPIEYRPTEEYGECDTADSSYKDFSASLIEPFLSQDKTVMILASCSYMLKGIIQELRQSGIPFHNPYRTKNGAWNPLARRGNSVSASDRLTAFLRMGEEGRWTKDDLRAWLSGARCSDILPSKTSYKRFEEGPLASIQEIDGGIPYELASILVGEEAIEASMAGNTAWYKAHLSTPRVAGSEYPCRIAEASGVDALQREPGVTIGTIHSVKGGESDVVILAPDLSQRGVETWHSGDAGKAAIHRLFYVGMTRAKQELHILQPASSSSAVRLL